MTPKNKRAETRKKKQESALKELGFERKKTKRVRKPMTEEQRAAAAERLAKAREKRMKGSIPAYVHPEVAALPEGDTFSYKNVKEWLDHNSEKLKSISSQKNAKESKLRAEYQDLFTYVSNLKKYITDGVWLDFRYGKDAEQRTRIRIIARSKTSRPEWEDYYGTEIDFETGDDQ